MSKIDDVIKKVQGLIKQYNPDQPRDPGGEGGGQWVPAGGGSNDGLPKRFATIDQDRNGKGTIRPLPTSDHSADFTRDPSDGGWQDEKWGEQPKPKTAKKPRLITGKEFAGGNTVVGDTVDMTLPEGSEGWKAQQRLKEHVNRVPKPKAKAMGVGSVVRFKSPMDSKEAGLRMKILEDNGDRVLVEAMVNMPIKPTYVHLKSDLEGG